MPLRAVLGVHGAERRVERGDGHGAAPDRAAGGGGQLGGARGLAAGAVVVSSTSVMLCQCQVKVVRAVTLAHLRAPRGLPLSGVPLLPCSGPAHRCPHSCRSTANEGCWKTARVAGSMDLYHDLNWVYYTAFVCIRSHRGWTRDFSQQKCGLDMTAEKLCTSVVRVISLSDH